MKKNRDRDAQVLRASCRAKIRTWQSTLKPMCSLGILSCINLDLLISSCLFPLSHGHFN